MSNSETFCELLARRRTILNNRNAPIRLETANPYINKDGTAKTDASGNKITTRKIYERRKAEILQYNQTSSIGGTLTRAQQYKQTIENVGHTTNRIVENVNGSTTTFGISTCFSDLYLPTSSSAAGIPGPSFIIQYRPEVPLYGYAINAEPIGITNTDSINAWSFNLGTNIQAIDGEWTTLIHVFHNIDNIDIELVDKDYIFNMDIPIGLYVAGDISGAYLIDSSSNHNFISSIDVRVLGYTGSILTTPIVQNFFNDISMSDISMNYVIDNSGNFKAIQYMGNLPLTATLRIQTLSYYEIQVKFNIISFDDNEYTSSLGVKSYVSAAYMNLTENNVGFKDNITTVRLVTSSGSTYSTPNYNDFKINGMALD
jgi:hypothetical protein